MRIAQLSTPHIPTPPPAYGGSELVAGEITEELVRRGHQVTLFANPHSRTSATLVSFLEVERVSSFDYRELVHVANAFRHAADFDIIHNHCLYAGSALAQLSPSPVVTTLHYIHHVLRSFPDNDYVAVSRSQMQLAAELRIREVIHNGIDSSKFFIADHKEEYLLFLGRFHPNKGVHLAIEVAKRSGHRLVIAAPFPPADQQEYFERQIRPHLNGRIDYVGEVKGFAKASLLARAKAVILPLTWDEPFGLVLLEAMASGTPVIALGRGSVPELVVHGRTGYVVDSVDAMVQAIDDVARIDPSQCRKHVEENFSVKVMVDRYEALYRIIVNERLERRR